MRSPVTVHNFLFHRVNPQRDPLWDPMSPELFERCIAYIMKQFHVVSFEREAITGFKTTSSKPLASVMFDDGYKDNIEYALPILQRLACPASFYVVTNGIESNTPTWTYLFDYYMFRIPSLPDMDFSFIPESLKRAPTDSKEKPRYITSLKHSLKSVSHEQRDTVLRYVAKQAVDIDAPKIMLSWDDLRQMQTAGFVIGSHTANHFMLGTLADNALVEEELSSSMNAIERNLGTKPVTISYPVGSYNRATVSLSEEVGYKIGLAVKQRVYNTSKDSIFEVPRIELYNEPWWKTRLRIHNRIEAVKRLAGLAR